MKNSKTKILLILLFIFLIGNSFLPKLFNFWNVLPCYSFEKQNEIIEAKSFFERYINLSHSYDSSLIDLYSDNAVIKRFLTYPDGKTSEVIIPAKKFKLKLRFLGPMARVIKYRNDYFDLKFTQEGNNIRIKGIRQVHSDHYISPVSFLIGKDTAGKLVIMEDITNTKAVKLF